MRATEAGRTVYGVPGTLTVRAALAANASHAALQFASKNSGLPSTHRVFDPLEMASPFYTLTEDFARPSRLAAKCPFLSPKLSS